MTQRLVAALVEDRNISQALELDRGRELSAPRAAALSHVKSLAFESRVRDELREQGILDGDEAPKVSNWVVGRIRGIFSPENNYSLSFLRARDGALNFSKLNSPEKKSSFKEVWH